MQNQQKPSKSQDVSHVKSPAQHLSTMPLANWRGSLTTFQGFTSTKPDRELVDVPWDEASRLMCPATPVQLANKENGQFFVPCLLKEAPLVGNTLDAAVKSGAPQTGKMRSKQHVTEARLLVMDVDGLSESDFAAGRAKIERDGLTFIAYTTHSHGSQEKPGVRARIAIPLDRPVDTEAYATAWRGFDRQYWKGLAGKADSSGANLCQQQGTWCCEKSRAGQAECWSFRGGIASTDALIASGKRLSAANIRIFPKQQTSSITWGSNGAGEGDYPPSDANKIADACRQIGEFRETKGAGQREPLWYDCLGVVGHCTNGEALCQTWSSGHVGYDAQKTTAKLANRIRTPPTTCAQFQKTYSNGCNGCAQSCNSPITLGWKDHADFEVVPFEVVEATPQTATATSVPVVPAQTSPDHLTGAAKTASKGERESTRLPFPEVEPYPDQIDATQLFDEISDTILQFIVLTKEQADAATLWIAMTWLIDVVTVAPLAIITAPEKACGKSQLLEVLSLLVSRPLPVAHMSASFLFRAVRSWEPTLLIDEADTFIRENEELKGLVNAGHTRASAYVGRTVAVGDDHEPRLFDVWGAKAFAGIALERHLPDSTMSRGIVFNLRRKTKDEPVTRLRYAERAMFGLLTSKLARFAADCAERVREARPTLPDALDDRAQDNWDPLLAIAKCAGASWVARATTAALSLSSTNDAPVSTGNELLADIQYVFDAKGTAKLSSADLIEALCEIEDGAWATYNHGKPLSPRQLSRLLSTYKISPKTVRMKHGTPKGYDLAQFADAFARYLSPRALPQQLNDWQEGMPSKAPCVADPTPPPSRTATARSPEDPAIATGTVQQEPTCGGVADVAAPTTWPGGTPPEDAF